MQKLVPLNKQSKKAQRAYHSKQRGSWYVPNKKAYDRNRAKRLDPAAM